MVTIKLNAIAFRLKEQQDFCWLKKYGKAFWCVDETGSGCVCIGMENMGKKYFCKIAGVNTIEAEVTPSQSVQILKNAVSLYYQLAHPNLVKIVEAYAHGALYIVVFEWAVGECLFDHWNFETYKNNPALKNPKEKFKQLPAGKKIYAASILFSFLESVNKKGYVAVDFYDSSILYDFQSDTVTICDIDLFKKAPVVNDRGAAWYGTKRLKAPEEYIKGAAIDEQTNIFTLGALLFEFFGSFSDDEIKRRYRENRFVPCAYEHWQLSRESYNVVKKAVHFDKAQRYRTFSEFYSDWKKTA